MLTCWTLSYYYSDAKWVLFLDWACQQHILFTVTKVLDEELIRICIRRKNHLSGCWDIYTLYPICWWLSCSVSFLFSSYVERQMCDWIYQCPQEQQAEMGIVVRWKRYILQHYFLHPSQWDSPGVDAGRYHLSGWWALSSPSVFTQIDWAVLRSRSSEELKFSCTS